MKSIAKVMDGKKEKVFVFTKIIKSHEEVNKTAIKWCEILQNCYKKMIEMILKSRNVHQSSFRSCRYKHELTVTL